MEEADRGGGIEPREVGIIKHLINNQDKVGPFGANLIVEIIEYLLDGRLNTSSWYHQNDPEQVFPKLVYSFKRDGYIIENCKLKTMLPEALQIAETEDELTTLLDQFQFSTTKGHFIQAVSAHTRGEWAAANAQMRSFVESMFDSIAETLVNDATALPSTSHNRRELLTRLDPPFLLTDLNEWEPNGKGFVQGFWNRLHPRGSHPGLSDEEDSTLRLHIIIIIPSHYMRRLNSRSGV